MIKAKHHFFIYPLFKWLTCALLKMKFYKVEFTGDFNSKKLPVLVIANHISWWDGFWLEYLNLKVLKRRLHFMMLEAQLKKHWYFNYTGGFSVRKNSVSLIDTIKYTAEILQKPDNMVFIFPQGEIKSMFLNKIKFERGAEKILKHCTNNVQVLFVANFIEYLSHSKPVLYMHFSEYKDLSINTDDLQQAYNDFYTNALNYHYNLAE